MDNILVNFKSGIDKLDKATYEKFNENYCKINTMAKFLFIVTDNHFYYCDLNFKYPIAPKTESIAKFIEFANELVGLGIKQEEQNKRREEEK